MARTDKVVNLLGVSIAFLFAGLVAWNWYVLIGLLGGYIALKELKKY